MYGMLIFSYLLNLFVLNGFAHFFHRNGCRKVMAWLGNWTISSANASTKMQTVGSPQVSASEPRRLDKTFGRIW